MNEFADKYDWIGEFHQGVAIVKKFEKYGAVMVGGKEIIPTIYDALSDFENGYAKAKYWISEFQLDSKVINLSGQVLVKKNNEVLSLPNEYEWGSDFVGNICVVRKDGKPGVINLDHSIIIPIGAYDYIYAISKELIKVAKDPIIVDMEGTSAKMRTYSLWGIVNAKGITIIPCQYSEISIYQEDACYIISIMDNRTRRYGVIDYRGEVLPFNYSYIGKLNSLFVYSINARAEFEDNIFCPDNFLEGSKFGLMDSAFNPLTEPIYDIIESNDDCIIVRNNNKLGLFNHFGKEIIKLGEYDYINFDERGLIKVAKGLIKPETDPTRMYSRWGVIDSNGKILALCRYSYVTIVEGPYIMACIKIPIDDIYDGREDLDEDDINYYDWVKCSENNPSFGYWEIMNIKGDIILDDIEGDEDNAQTALDCFLNDSDSYDMDCYSSRYSKYGGYNGWDDNTIDEAFDGNPELTWNID